MPKDMKKQDNEFEESSDEENPIPDFDICNEAELNRSFKACEPAYEIQVGESREYVLHLATSRGSKNILGTATSKGVVKLYDIGETAFKKYPAPESLNQLDSLVCGLRFDPNNDHLLYCARACGICTCFDLRSNEKVFEFKDESNNKAKTFTCMDVNQNSRLVCCGTDKIGGDAFLVFFDTRQRTLLGGYWESHDDDITDVRFHSRNPDALASCSTDGLLNVYDLKQATEDDALVVSFNTESSASSATWYRQGNNDHLVCITDTNDVQLYNVDAQDKIHEFSREQITKYIKRNSHIDCYLIGCYVEDVQDEVHLLATSNFNKGECLRSLKLSSDNKSLESAANFTRAQQIIRCCEYDSKNKILLTGGESGLVQLWNLDGTCLPTDSQLLKDKSKLKKHKKSKPY